MAKRGKPSPVSPEQLLGAYANGYFPMALDKEDPELYWFSPEERGVLPLDAFNIPRGLKRSMKTRPYRVTVDTAFEEVIRACGTLTPERHETWINETIVGLYVALFDMGCAHSVEVWELPPPEGEGWGGGAHGKAKESGSEQASLPPNLPPMGGGTRVGGGTGPRLIGGLYGVSLGGAFFGESMFSRAPDASKIALVNLVEVLREAGYALLDTQYVNDHLLQFGVQAIAKADYMMKLENALNASPNPSSRFSTASVRKGLASASSTRDISPLK